MATIYSIYFQNNYGSTLNYGFLMAPPKADLGPGTDIYSNLLLSRSMTPNDFWDIEVSKTYYAYCAKLPEEIRPGLKVTGGSTKLVRLGSSSVKGSTCVMFNNGGAPSFNAALNCYEIVTGGDFHETDHFVCGLGTTDQFGSVKPASVFDAPRNSTVSINPVTTFYLISPTQQVGTIINVKDITTKHAVIDFTTRPNMYGATVTHQPNGDFRVQYTASQRAHLQKVSALKAEVATPDTPIDDDIQRLLSRNSSTKQLRDLWICSILFRNDPTPQQKDQVYKHMRKSMENNGYVYFGDSYPEPNILWITFENLANNPVEGDWSYAYSQLSSELKLICTDGGVKKDVASRGYYTRTDDLS